MFHHDSQQWSSECTQVWEYTCYTNNSFPRLLGLVKVMIHKEIRIATEQRRLVRGESWKIEVSDVSVVQEPIFVFFVKPSARLRRQEMQLQTGCGWRNSMATIQTIKRRFYV